MCWCFIFLGLNMSRNERHRADKRASSSRARSRGNGLFYCFLHTFYLNLLKFFVCNVTIDSPRRELENVVKRARKDRDQSQYWINRVLEAEEKDPNRYFNIV